MVQQITEIYGRYFRVLWLALLIEAWISPLAHGATIYVDHLLTSDCVGTYSIANRDCQGSDGDAFDRVKEGTHVVQAGEAVYIRAGTYTQQDITFANSGQPGAPITVAAYPGEEGLVILQQVLSPPGGRGIFSLVDIVGHPPGYGHYIFRGLTMRHVGNAFWLGSASARVHDILLDNIIFHDNETAIKTEDMGVERIIIRNCVAYNHSSADGAFNFKVNINQQTAPGSGSKNIILLNSIIRDNSHSKSSGIILQEQSQHSIFIGNVSYGNGQYSFTSKGGGYHIWLNNKAYGNGKGGYYLGGPLKEYGNGDIINAAPANYILLNNVAIGRRVVDGGALISWWRPANVWLYHNTSISLKEDLGLAGNTGLSSLRSMMTLSYDFVTTGYARNNIFYQAYGWNVHWYELAYNESTTLPRTYQGDYNLHYSFGRLETDGGYKIYGSEVNGQFTLNLNLNFQTWKDWFLTTQGDAVDAFSVWGDPGFVGLDRTTDASWQDLRLSTGSPAINAGQAMGTDTDDYPGKVEAFLSQGWNYFDDFDDAILAPAEKAALLDQIRNAHLSDIDGTSRDVLPDIGAFEFVAPGPVSDTTPPTVSISSPADGAIVSGTITVSAAASDNVGVAGVQFKLDGADLGAEDTTTPYVVTWDISLVANGSHTLSAVARDAAGNTGSSLGRMVTVSNNTHNSQPRIRIKRAPGAEAVYLKGNLALVVVELEEGLAPISSVTLQYTDMDGAGFTYSKPLQEIRALEYAGYMDTRALGAGSGAVQYYVEAQDQLGISTRTPTISYRLAEEIEVSSVDGQRFTVPDGNPADGDLQADLPPESGLPILRFKRLDPNDPRWRAHGEKGIDPQYGDRGAAVYEVSVPGHASYVFNQPVTLALLYDDLDGLDGDKDGLPDGDGVVDGGSIPEQTLRLYWHDGLEWRLLGGEVDALRNTVKAQVKHFSIFGLFSEATGNAGEQGAKALEKFLSPSLVDGINDVATFGPEAAEVQIFDVLGRKVFEALRQGQSAIQWNCRDEGGGIVESGIYIAKIRKRDDNTVYQSFAVVK